ncbi:class E sortase [Rubrobacter marinus]|uniref:class E sortase n=1 Tax=Rubrobacter marinus TaxID=2653852 RepID=UPI0014096E8B|nr:class E sortase [Rubrobacter marinus]
MEALGVYDVPVANEAGDAALDRGPIHLPDTQMPWDEGEQKNIYIAGHRLGYRNTNSRLLFYHLDRLRAGDRVAIEGRGRVFEYRVSEMLVVDPSDRWAKAPVRGRDMVSLQTCTPIPTFEKRLVVRADRV